MKIRTLFEHPERFEITSLSGGYLGGAEKVSIKGRGDQYILKPMGENEEQITHALTLLEHIKGFGEVFPNMAKVCDWERNESGTLLALFEFIEDTEGRLPTIPEMLRISSQSFLASKQYDHTVVSPEVDFQKTTLYEIKNNGVERYTEKYFGPYVKPEMQAVIDWMGGWADYFIHARAFRNQYLACAGYIHRDIHRHNIIIQNGEPVLIDFDFSGVDCRLIEITRPTNVYIEVDDFLPMVAQAKEINLPHFTETEVALFDRVLVLDIMANLGWEASEIYKAEEGEYKDEIVNFLQNRVSFLYLLMTNRDQFHLECLHEC